MLSCWKEHTKEKERAYERGRIPIENDKEKWEKGGVRVKFHSNKVKEN